MHQQMLLAPSFFLPYEIFQSFKGNTSKKNFQCTVSSLQCVYKVIQTSLLTSEHTPHTPKKPQPTRSHSPFLSPFDSQQTLNHFLSLQTCLFYTFHNMRPLLQASLTRHKIFKAHPCCRMYFISFYCQIVDQYVNTPHVVHPLIRQTFGWFPLL